jgi:hypothetical protein
MNTNNRYRFILFILFYLIYSLPLCAKTYFISGKGSDNNPGSRVKPFKTISKGAEFAQPGDTVFVMEGIYRERVSPPVGGTAENPIVYWAEPGKRVFIKGSDVYDKKWKTIAKGISAADLNLLQFTDDVYWDSANPFKIGLTSTPYGRDGIPEKVMEINYTLGQVFVEGKPYLQTPLKKEMETQAGSWWYDPDKNQVLLHFKPGQSTKNQVEITTRRRIFAPHVRGLGYIHVIGFIMEHCGNQFPRDFWEKRESAQSGALGLRSGHHWVVKNNVIRYAANIGIDCGNEGPDNEQSKQATISSTQITGNLFENNYLIDNGCNGIAGESTKDMIVRGNVVMYNNNLMYMGDNRYEQAGMKFHNLTDGLIYDNFVAENYAYGIWLDNRYFHSHLFNNYIIRNQKGIKVEMGDYDFGAVLIDRNIIMNNVENQFYMHDASGVLVVNNLMAGSKLLNTEEFNEGIKSSEQYGQGVYFRQITNRTRSYHNSFYNNIVCNNDISFDVPYPLAKAGEQRFLGNLYDHPVMRINDMCDYPSPFNAESFLKRVAEDMRTTTDSISYEPSSKRIQMSLAEWQKFWLQHSLHNDNDAQVMPSLSAVYLPDSRSVRLTLSELPKKRANYHWDGNYRQIYHLTETNVYPGPFPNLQAGTHEYSPYLGLPRVERGELPDPQVFLQR